MTIIYWAVIDKQDGLALALFRKDKYTFDQVFIWMEKQYNANLILQDFTINLK